MQPFKYDPDGVPCYSTNQIDDYGFPEQWGVEVYRVIDSRDKPMVSDFKMEHQYDLRKIHRYDRIARFRSILYNLVGERGHVPPEVITVVGQYIDRKSPDLWNACRKVMKHFGYRLYYNRIPVVLKELKLGQGFEVLGYPELEHIVNKFKQLVDIFYTDPKTFGRKYFPNFRYVALRLLDDEGYSPGYEIPMIRTVRKTKQLDELWDRLRAKVFIRLLE